MKDFLEALFSEVDITSDVFDDFNARISLMHEIDLSLEVSLLMLGADTTIRNLGLFRRDLSLELVFKVFFVVEVVASRREDTSHLLFFCEREEECVGDIVRFLDRCGSEVECFVLFILHQLYQGDKGLWAF